MVLYNCIQCNYSTSSNSNYNKHLNTKKHRNNIESLSDNQSDKNVFNKRVVLCNTNATLCENYATICNTNTKNVEDNNFVCKFCNKYFNKHQSYYRHMKYYCKKKQIQRETQMNENEQISAKLSTIKEENHKEMQNFVIEILNKQNENMKNTVEMILNDNNKKNEQLLNMISSNRGNTNNFTQNNTMNNTNYVLNYFDYKDADSMNNIKNKFKLTREEFIKASLTNGYKGALMEKADSIIIQPYLKYQEKRPMQTVDVSRKKALYKDNQSESWTFTPKITLEQCFKEFHLSALSHQDQTINENPNLLINNIEDSLYKQTYFIPRDMKEKENIYRDVKNHIYKNTKVNKIEKGILNNHTELDLLCFKENDKLFLDGNIIFNE